MFDTTGISVKNNLRMEIALWAIPWPDIHLSPIDLPTDQTDLLTNVWMDCTYTGRKTPDRHLSVHSTWTDQTGLTPLLCPRRCWHQTPDQTKLPPCPHAQARPDRHPLNTCCYTAPTTTLTKLLSFTQMVSLHFHRPSLENLLSYSQGPSLTFKTLTELNCYQHILSIRGCCTTACKTRPTNPHQEQQSVIWQDTDQR
ncbi:hypothetical protein E2C01_017501 [Portunus trituberculatus]|uniref:Uncharacterized protein n=1 Tax=Portunus trituberculatus TaxID=210409 RepID=A0A5B7DSM6_PORTR|nr:hypothetical protein [Portunus trituberculatus]